MEIGLSYVPAHRPYHIESDMKHMKSIGCTEVLFALQENHVRTLDGAIRYGAKIAKENGLRPYAIAWGFANTFGGGRMSMLLLEDTGMWRMKKDGTPVPMVCLNNPRIVEHFVEIAGLFRDNGYEGIFIDEPTVQECFCDRCRALFSDRHGNDIAQSEGTPEYAAFQKETVSIFTGAVCKGVKTLDPGFKTLACIMPVDREIFDAVAAIPELDILGTDPYWLIPEPPITMMSIQPGSVTSLEDAVDYARLIKGVCAKAGKASQIWLNCWGITRGKEEDIYTGGKQLAAVGCDAIYTWTYRAGLGTPEECEDMVKSWASVERLYRELSGA